MTLDGLREQALPYAQAVLLAAALGLGGLRSPLAWLAFGALLPVWFWFTRGALRVSFAPAPALFFLWLGIAALFSPEPGLSAAAFAKSSLLALLFFSAAASPRGEQGWVAAVLGLGALCAAVLLAQRLAGLQVTGLIGANPNYSAVFAAAAFPAAALALPGGAWGKKKLFYAALCAGLAAGIIASGSRGALLAAFVSAAAGLAVSGRRRALLVLATGAAAAAVLVPAAAWEDVFKFSDPRAFARPRIWLTALQAALAGPFLGWGPGRFDAVFELFKFPYFDGVSFYGHATQHAHSEPLNLAAEAGFPAALFFLLAAYTSLARDGVKRLPVKLCALAALLQGSVDMIFYSGAVGALFWGSLGFSAGGEEPEARQTWPAARPALLCLAVLAAGLLFALPGKELYYERAAAAEAASGDNRALSLALARLRALKSPRSAIYAAEEGRARAAAGDAAGAEAAFRSALGLEPYFAGARLDLAELYFGAGDRERACAETELAARPAGPAAGPYQRLLTRPDPRLGRFRNYLCLKMKPGGNTVPRLKTR